MHVKYDYGGYIKSQLLIGMTLNGRLCDYNFNKVDQLAKKLIFIYYYPLIFPCLCVNVALMHGFSYSINGMDN